MTESQFELFDIYCGDFVRNLQFFHSQCEDEYTQVMLQGMISKVRQYRRVIQEAVDSETV